MLRLNVKNGGLRPNSLRCDRTWTGLSIRPNGMQDQLAVQNERTPECHAHGYDGFASKRAEHVSRNSFAMLESRRSLLPCKSIHRSAPQIGQPKREKDPGRTRKGEPAKRKV